MGKIQLKYRGPSVVTYAACVSLGCRQVECLDRVACDTVSLPTMGVTWAASWPVEEAKSASVRGLTHGVAASGGAGASLCCGILTQMCCSRPLSHHIRLCQRVGMVKGPRCHGVRRMVEKRSCCIATVEM